MFADEKVSAKSFFSQFILNSYLMNCGLDTDSQIDFDSLMKDIIKQLFAPKAFDCLICGTQGVPRAFVMMFKSLLNELQINSDSKIRVSSVYKCIIANYTTDVRQRIPESSKICDCIDAYIEKTHHRFFVLSIKEYNRTINYIDGIVPRAIYIKAVLLIVDSHIFWLLSRKPVSEEYPFDIFIRFPMK